METPPPLIYTSTNKVYGGLHDVALNKNGSRYEPEDEELRARGISETRPLDFHTPYGCSKGAAEQYVLDYARSFGGPAAVFRMSCIYGPHQFGTEDQGWVAHFLIQAMEGRPITIYGDGLQVRDVLFVEDLVDALLLAQERMPSIAGQAFNIGGGPQRTVSLIELLAQIERIDGVKPRVQFEEARTGDQRYYVSDTGKFTRATGWQPRTSVGDGIRSLYEWLAETRRVAAETVAG
jgi:CDP-paratose 2-epimerase